MDPSNIPSNIDPSSDNYDPQAANSMLQLQQAMAMKMMSAQNQSQGQIVPGGNGEGWYVPPSKLGALSAAMQNVTGAYMAKNNIQQQSKNTQAQNAQLMAALQSTQAPVTVPGQLQAPTPNAPGYTPSSTPPADGLDYIQPTVGKYSLPTQRSKTLMEQMPDLLKMSRDGELGQSYANMMLMPHPGVSLAPGATLVNPLTGNKMGDSGSSGDPALMRQVNELRLTTSPTNSAAIAYLNDLERRAGQAPSTPASLQGSQATPEQNSNIAVNQAKVPQIQAETAAVPITAGAAASNAAAHTTEANTGAANLSLNAQKTAVDLTTAHEGYGSAKAGIPGLIAQLDRMDQLYTTVNTGPLAGALPNWTAGRQELKNLTGQNVFAGVREAVDGAGGGSQRFTQGELQHFAGGNGGLSLGTKPEVAHNMIAQQRAVLQNKLDTINKADAAVPSPTSIQ